VYTKFKLAAAAVFVILLAVTGGVVLRHKVTVTSEVRQLLVKGGFKNLASTGQSAALPIKRKPSAVPTPNAVYYRDKVIVLMYHEVTKTQTDPKTLLLGKFKEQLQLMKSNGFHWISMSQYRNFILHHGKIPDNAVLLTFDDGYESFYQDAFPLLEHYHAPATNFVIVNTIDNPKHAGLSKLTWKQIKVMHKQGIDFYNHTFDSHSYAYTDLSHRHTRALLDGPIYSPKDNAKETEAQFENRIYKDLLKAQMKLHQEVGNNYDVLAFPYGAFSEDTLKVCRSLGIEVTFTVKRGINGPGQLNGYRVNAGGQDNNPAVTVEYMKEAAPEPAQTQTLNRPYDILGPDTDVKSGRKLVLSTGPAEWQRAS
jgi:poly-beta-1,6-N-acetyl-D-glucosamine N-deacetylase